MVVDSLEHLRFDRQEPEAVPDDVWAEGQELLLQSFINGTGMTLAQADALTRYPDTDGFRAARINPQIDVAEGRLNPDQSFADGLVVTAWDGKRLVGWEVAFNNTSGETEEERDAKMNSLFGLRRYNWIREGAVDEHYRHRGVLSVMTGLVVAQRARIQPTAVYLVSPSKENPLADKLTSPQVGFKASSEPKLNEETGLHMQRLQIRTGKLRKSLERRPEIAHAIMQAEDALST